VPCDDHRLVNDLRWHRRVFHPEELFKSAPAGGGAGGGARWYLSNRKIQVALITPLAGDIQDSGYSLTLVL
jgi:hypothetical protein